MKEIIFDESFSLKQNENGLFDRIELEIAASMLLGFHLVERTERGDVIMTNGQGKFFLTKEDSPSMELIDQLGTEYNAEYLAPMNSKSLCQQLMKVFPMLISSQVANMGELVARWIVESNTVFGAGNPEMGIRTGRDSWVVTASENICEAIVLNALRQAGCMRQAAIHFTKGIDSASLIWVTPETAAFIQNNPQLSASTVFVPAFDRYALTGVPPEELESELATAKLEWQVAITRFYKAQGQKPPKELFESEHAEQPQPQQEPQPESQAEPQPEQETAE